MSALRQVMLAVMIITHLLFLVYHMGCRAEGENNWILVATVNHSDKIKGDGGSWVSWVTERSALSCCRPGCSTRPSINGRSELLSGEVFSLPSTLQLISPAGYIVLHSSLTCLSRLRPY